jgi:hypothetical protein
MEYVLYDEAGASTGPITLGGQLVMETRDKIEWVNNMVVKRRAIARNLVDGFVFSIGCTWYERASGGRVVKSWKHNTDRGI